MKKRLDYLVIPNSGGEIQKERKERAKKEHKNRKIEKIIVLKGKDSEEDVLRLGKILKKGDRIGIDTFRLHFKEYLELIRKAKRDGKFSKGVKIENIKIHQNFHLFVYGILGYWEEKIKDRKLAYVKNRHEKILNFMKKIAHKIIRL